ncbi:MAG TPA: hydrogenase nickel incorporation protein HypB, partial [Burkholderiales bacterium]|nr:hydrogenase nickel incorporation protein HypB [Burkholderiales bacterium]
RDLRGGGAMCATCGCSAADVRVTGPGHTHEHGHGHGHPQRTVDLQVDLLAGNDELAARNRRALAERGVVAVNLMSSPGSGKTTLLERTVRDLGGQLPIGVLEGDQETRLDAERISATGVPAVQINTGAGCHLEADMLERALALLGPRPGSMLMIENVGNLVCPALFDLGERAKVVIFSVTEGEDKPLKYPHMFRAAKVLVLTKTDLLPHVRFDMARAVANALEVNPALEVFQVSAYTGEGLECWYAWLRSELALCAGNGNSAANAAMESESSSLA